jgi:hypothetical protein
MKYALYITIAVAFASPIPSYAQECWIATNLKGYSAFADEGYTFSKDGLSNPVLICFDDDGGTVTGADIRFVKFGASTLAGYSGNNKGNELFEVYQIDKENEKLLYTKTRIGTKNVAPILSDVVSSYVGDVKRVSE